jgi:hypothetical protein
MLKTTIEHFYGSQEKHSIELVKLQLDTSNLDEKEALENGWLLDSNRWYQCRSTRLQISKYNIKNELPNSFSISYSKEPNSILKDLYRQYIAIRGFNDLVDYFETDSRSSFLVLSDEQIPVAFTKFIHYAGGLESQLTCWNYHKPKLQIGKKIISYEIEYARSLGLDYLYIGEGVESSSIYKADLDGFQYWTGSVWSEDRSKYKELCIRDSSVKTIYDLSDIFNKV